MMNMLKAWIPAFAGMTLLVSGCVTREDIRGIQTDLVNIQKGLEKRIGSVEDQTGNVQTSQADLLNEMRELNGNLTVLQAELQDSRARMGQLSSRLDDLEASLTARMDSQIELLSGSKFVEKPLPSTVFNLANTDFARGRYPEALKGFQSYLKQFPKGEKVAEAKLKIGESHAKQSDWDAAVQAYDVVIREHPKHALVPSAVLKKGGALESAGRKSAARDAYAVLLKSYPHSPEAKTAQDRLRNLHP